MKKILILVAFIFALAPMSAVFAQDGHEYAPLQEKTVNYKDWTFNNLKDDAPVNLRALAKDKNTKLLMVVYFAPWCPNWRNEAPIAAKLYEEYKAQGLNVVGISEYGARDDVKKFFGDAGAPYTVVTESEARDQRDKTSHFTYRQSTGDTRRWGSPWNIFLEPKKLKKDGDVIAEKAYIVNGELIEADAEQFVREHLGLNKEKDKDKSKDAKDKDAKDKDAKDKDKEHKDKSDKAKTEKEKTATPQ